MMLKTLGHDTEFFIGYHDKNMNPNIVSAIGRLGGTKEEPRAMSHGTIQEDNILAEIGSTPASTRSDWNKQIELTIMSLKHELNSRGLSLFPDITSKYVEDKVIAQPEAQIIGCEPDFNAWTMTKNPKPRFRKDTKNLRTAGGHVHLGVTGKDPIKKALLIRYMDLFLGVPSVTMDNDSTRRMLYGKAGAHRPKEYGVEYRTLSNFWVRHGEYRSWVWDRSKKAVSCVDEDPLGLMDHEGEMAHDIQLAINTSDTGLAYKLMEVADGV